MVALSSSSAAAAVKSRFIVSTVSAQCGSRCRYLQPRIVRVLDTMAGPGSWHWIRHGVVGQWGHHAYQSRGRLLDGRYDGPRSAYGQALDAAMRLASRLNAEHETALLAGSGI